MASPCRGTQTREPRDWAISSRERRGRASGLTWTHTCRRSRPNTKEMATRDAGGEVMNALAESCRISLAALPIWIRQPHHVEGLRRLPEPRRAFNP